MEFILNNDEKLDKRIPSPNDKINIKKSKVLTRNFTYITGQKISNMYLTRHIKTLNPLPLSDDLLQVNICPFDTSFHGRHKILHIKDDENSRHLKYCKHCKILFTSQFCLYYSCYSGYSHCPAFITSFSYKNIIINGCPLVPENEIEFYLKNVTLNFKCLCNDTGYMGSHEKCEQNTFIY